MNKEPIFDTDESLSSAKKWRYAGWGLIAVAVAIPQFMNIQNEGGAAGAGAEISRSLGQLLFVALIAWLMTRKGSSLKMAKGTFYAGLVMVITSASVAANQHNDKALVKEFLEKAFVVQAENRAQLDNVQIRINEIDFNSMLTMPAVTDPAARSRSLAELSRHRALLLERDAVLAGMVTKTQEMIAGMPEGEMRRGALEGAQSSKNQMADLFKELAPAQLALNSSVEELLKYMNSLGNRVTTSPDGQPLFQTQQELDKFRQLATVIDETSLQLNQAVEIFEQKRQAMVRQAEQQQRDAQRLTN